MRQPADSESQPTLDVGPLSAAANQASPAKGPALSPSLRTLLSQMRDLPQSSILSLVRADQRKRWQRGERLDAEVYLAQLPVLKEHEESALDLIFSEIMMREELGEQPQQDEYLGRFPQYRGPVQRQFLLNRALESSVLVELPSSGSTLDYPSAAVPTSPDAGVAARRDGSGGGGAGATCALPGVSPPIGPTRQEVEPGETVPGDASPITKPARAKPTLGRGALSVPPPFVPGYEILAELGRGGMGVVYKARQVRLKRLVALKMILSGAHASEQDLARLKSEAEAVARLQHPNIVQIHEVGNYEGLPYLSLEYVEGGSLADKLKGQPIPGKQAAQIIERLALAMYYAHQQGIVHRDLKPANVLLATVSTAEVSVSTPELAGSSVDAVFGRPKITDFGLAKDVQAGESGLTRSGAIVGTPSYMAPEQAAGKTRGIGPHTDVYALGAILYELLTGRPPFRAATAVDTVLQVMSEEPVPPSRLEPKVPRDLENICLKCLQKEPARRYPTALALAEDLCAFLESRPVTARPIGVWERSVKWARRNPPLAGAIAAIAAVFVISFVLVLWRWQVSAEAWKAAVAAAKAAVAAGERERAEKDLKEEALQRARRSLYFNRIALAERGWSANDVSGVVKLLDEADKDYRSWEWYYLRRLSSGGKWRLNGRRTVAISRADRWLASVHGPDVKLWSLSHPQEEHSLRGHTSDLTHVAFSADGRRLAAGSEDGSIKIWDVAGRRLLLSMPPDERDDPCLPVAALAATSLPTACAALGCLLYVADKEESAALRPPIKYLAFQPEGRLLAAASEEGSIQLWDAGTGKKGRTLSGHDKTVNSVAFNPDGRYLASASDDCTIKIWDPQSGQVLNTLEGHLGPVTSVAYSDDRRFLASGSDDESIIIWDQVSGRQLNTLRGHSSRVHCLAFGGDGQLASASGDILRPGDVKLWDPATAREIYSYRWTTKQVTGVALAHSGQWLASADSRSVLLWDARNDPESRSLREHTEGVMCVAFSPTGNFLASAGEDWSVKIWNVAEERIIHNCFAHTATVNAIAYSPDGRYLASASDDQTVRIWDTDTGQVVHTLRGHTTEVRSVAFTPDSKLLASAASTREAAGELKLWEVKTGKEVHTIPGGWVHALAFSPDGRRLAGGTQKDFRVVVWDPATGERQQTHTGFLQPISAVAFSPNGRWLAAAGGSLEEGFVRLWQTATGQPHQPIRSKTGRISCIAFDPRSERLAAASWDNSIKIFDPESAQDVLTLRGHAANPAGGVMGLSFSADGWRLASAGLDKTVKIWDATPLPGTEVAAK